VTDPNHHIDTYEFSADGAGLFAMGPLVSWRQALEPGDYVPGNAVHAWFTRVPVARWGRQWVATGGMRLRYRRHLDAGTSVVVTAEHTDGIVLTMRDRHDQTVYAEAVATVAATAPEVDMAQWPPTTLYSAKAPPTAEGLAGLRLGDIHFTFDADRDLPPDGWLPDAAWWNEQRCANPAWLSGGINLLLSQNIAFVDGWTHAGTTVQSLRPIEHQSAIALRGQVARLFAGGRHQFADVEVLVVANGEPSLLMTHTIVYAPDRRLVH